MEKQTTKHTSWSSPLWEQLEAFVRQHLQHWIQALLEGEVTTLLQRRPLARRTRVDAPSSYRTGFIALISATAGEPTCARQRPFSVRCIRWMESWLV